MEPIQKEETSKSKLKLAFEKLDPRFLYITLITVLLLGGGLGIYLWRQTSKAAEKGNSISISQVEPSGAPKSVGSQSAATSQSNTSTQITAPSVQKTTKSFNFVDYANWTEINSKDGSYTLKFGPNETHGYCANDKTTTLLGMIYMDQTGEYDCNSIMSALITGNPSKMLTRVAFGLSTTSPNASDPVEVTLLNNVSSKRYEFITQDNGKTFNNIEYIASSHGINYSAHLRWEQGYDLYKGSNVTPEYFDTIVQKTWTFN